MSRFLLFVFITFIGVTTINGQNLQAEPPYQIRDSVLYKINPRRGSYTIRVRNQEQFDRINDEISNALGAKYKDIKVIINKGVYHFSENHINRNNEQYPGVSIKIKGKDVVITSLNENTTKLLQENKRDDLIQADSLIEIIDEKKQLCRIPYANSFDINEKSHLTKVQITQWYLAPVFTVAKIDNNGIFFISADINANSLVHNVNDDYKYLGKTPRFRLLDNRKDNSSTASQFIKLNRCRFKELSIAGITFKDNKKGRALIEVESCSQEQFIINRCKFEEINDRCGLFLNTDNVEVKRCSFCCTAGNELSFGGGCKNIKVINNLFNECGTAIGNTFCVTCNEAEYYIANNTFVDFGYSAIGVGLWHGHQKRYPTQGVIEKNELYFTPGYFANCLKYTLMDGGAIYTWSQNDGVSIRYNYIHDYNGAGDNRGILCDDGASNVIIYGNIVLNIPNSYCIDLRCLKDHTDNLNNNSNNYLAENVVDGRIRFQGYENENRHAKKGKNYILLRENGISEVENEYDNLEVMEDDVILNTPSGISLKRLMRKSSHF